MIHPGRVPRWQVPAMDTLTELDRLEQTTLGLHSPDTSGG